MNFDPAEAPVPDTPPVDGGTSLIMSLDSHIRQTKEALDTLIESWTDDVDTTCEIAYHEIKALHDKWVAEYDELIRSPAVEMDHTHALMIDALNHAIYNTAVSLANAGCYIPGISDESGGSGWDGEHGPEDLPPPPSPQAIQNYNQGQGTPKPPSGNVTVDASSPVAPLGGVPRPGPAPGAPGAPWQQSTSQPFTRPKGELPSEPQHAAIHPLPTPTANAPEHVSKPKGVSRPKGNTLPRGTVPMVPTLPIASTHPQSGSVPETLPVVPETTEDVPLAAPGAAPRPIDRPIQPQPELPDESTSPQTISVPSGDEGTDTIVGTEYPGNEIPLSRPKGAISDTGPVEDFRPESTLIAGYTGEPPAPGNNGIAKPFVLPPIKISDQFEPYEGSGYDKDGMAKCKPCDASFGEGKPSDTGPNPRPRVASETLPLGLKDHFPSNQLSPELADSPVLGQRATVPSWCVRAERMRQIATAIGNELLGTEQRMTMDYLPEREALMELFGMFWIKFEKGTISLAVDRMFAVATRTKPRARLEMWISDATKDIGGYNSGSLPVRATMLWLSSLANAKLNDDFDAEEGTKSERVSTDNIDVGAGGHATTQKGSSSSVQQALPPGQSAGTSKGSGIGGGLEGSAKHGESRADTDYTGGGSKASFKVELTPFILPLVDALQYIIDALELPETLSVEQALQAFLANTINHKVYLCYCAMRGVAPVEANLLAVSNRTRLDPNQVVDCYRRGLITSAEMWERMRQDGVLSTHDAELQWQLSRQIPSPGDVVRFMTRDVEDTKLIERFGMDQEFDEKFLGLVEQYARAHGLEVADMLRYWRAHWQLPALGQVFEMVRRLRPDTEYGKNPELLTTEKDLEALMGQDDTLPFWRKRLIAISYHPLTRVDSQRAYFLGVIDEKRLQGAYQDIGYNKTDAETLVRFTAAQKQQYLERRPESRAYRDGAIGREEYLSRLSRYGLTGDAANAQADQIEWQVKGRLQRACIQAIKRRYLRGEMDIYDAAQELRSRNVSEELVSRYQSAWNCERDARGKEIPASTVCQWYMQGIISEASYLSRLIRLGYTEKDARFMLRGCNAKKAKAEKADTAKAEREADAEARKAKAEKNREERARARIRTAGARLVKQFDIDIGDAIASIDSTISRLVSLHEWEREEVTPIVLDATKTFKGSSTSDFYNYCAEMATAELAFTP